MPPLACSGFDSHDINKIAYHQIPTLTPRVSVVGHPFCLMRFPPLPSPPLPSPLPQLTQGLAPLDAEVEAVLTAQQLVSGQSVPVTLVVGLPGADQSLVASSLCTALAGVKAAKVALLPGSVGCGTRVLALLHLFVCFLTASLTMCSIMCITLSMDSNRQPIPVTPTCNSAPHRRWKPDGHPGPPRRCGAVDGAGPRWRV